MPESVCEHGNLQHVQSSEIFLTDCVGVYAFIAFCRASKTMCIQHYNERVRGAVPCSAGIAIVHV